MKMQLIRNATLKLHYGGTQFLIDPYLGEKHTQPTFAGKSPNPTVDLTIHPEEVIAGAQIVLVSHLHPDHFDETAERLLPKDIELFCQPPDAVSLKSKGFSNLRVLENDWEKGGLKITRTTGKHGHDERLQMMGPVSGFIFQHPDEPTVYWMGDTVWYPSVQSIVEQYRPDIIVTHSCGAIWAAGEHPVIMDEKQTIEVCQFAPNAKVVATHMEALDLATVSRTDLRQYAENNGISETRLLIPEDGEELLFQRQVSPLSDAKAFAQKWINSWNSHDLTDILQHYSEDIEVTTPMIKMATGVESGTLKGKDKVAAYWGKALEKLTDLKFELIDVTQGVDSIALYYKSVMNKMSVEVMFFDKNGLVNKMIAHYSPAE